MPKQIETISAINLAQFIAEKTNRNLFLTGKAGTGKTWFLKEFKEHTKKKVVVLAPTGISAINANAQTIHSFFRFSFSPYIPVVQDEEQQEDEAQKVRLQDNSDEVLKALDMIIIDEISMVRADLLDRIDDKLRKVRNSEQCFGGVQLLLIGDLLQLPPVVNREDKVVLEEYYNGIYYFFNSDAIKKVGFETVCLNKVYRQNDKEFIRLLDKARIGDLSWPQIAKLNTRYFPAFEAEKDSRYITMVSTRQQADKINNSRMEGISGNDKSYEASITGKFPKDAYPVPEKLSLKVGAQVMFTKNNYESDYRNGTIGQVSGLGEEYITVTVEGNEIVVEPTSWNSIEYTLIPETRKIKEEIVGSFTQFPLKPAWAITVHKSQGLTFDNAVIDVPHSFESGQGYVAFSRCRTLEGIVLKKKVYPNTFFVDKVIVDFYDGLVTSLAKVAKKVSYIPFEWEEVEDDDVATTDTNLAEALKNWRLKLSHSLALPAYTIISNKSLNEIASTKPQSIEQLLQIHGIGLAKVDKYGEDIINIVTHHNKEERSATEHPQAGAPQSSQVKKKTWEISYDMYKSGMSVSEIASKRGFTKETIYNHLTRYVESGELDAHDFVSEDLIRSIRRFKEANPDSEGLKPIFEALDGNVSYSEIRFALKCL